MNKKYSVNLARGYLVTVNAESAEQAARIAEFFVGNPKDESEDKHRAKHNFSIGEIELAMNEAMEVTEMDK